MLPGYWQRTFELGPDPDGEGELVATLVSRGHPDEDAAHRARDAVLVVHGFTDYFFHEVFNCNEPVNPTEFIHHQSHMSADNIKIRGKP